MHRVRCLLFSSLVLIACVGCGDNNAIVSGKVTFNGEPVSRGMISLEPVDGIGPTDGANLEGGVYHIDDVLPGEKLVRISAVHVVGTEKVYPEDPKSTDVIELTEELLPNEFNNGSTLKLTVSAPETQKDFALEGKDPRQGKK
jgi:hypothetical protein